MATATENMMVTTGGFGRAAAGTNSAANEYIPLVIRIMVRVRGAVRVFQDDHPFWPPEMMEYSCDLHQRWVDDLIEQYRPDFESFVATATQADFDTLLRELFTEAIWAGNRRAFFGQLHALALRIDGEGKAVSPALVAFYRARYNPHRRFRSER